MSLINKMNVGNTDYDIQDRLMPDAIGQAGQVLKVKDDRSGLEFSTIESGGKLYKHYTSLVCTIGGTTTLYLYIYSISPISKAYDDVSVIPLYFISGTYKDPSSYFVITEVIRHDTKLQVYYLTESQRILEIEQIFNILTDNLTEL